MRSAARGGRAVAKNKGIKEFFICNTSPSEGGALALGIPQETG